MPCRLQWAILLPDVLLHEAQRFTARRPGEVGAGPEFVGPAVVLDEVGELLAEPVESSAGRRLPDAGMSAPSFLFELAFPVAPVGVNGLYARGSCRVL
ncbi:predicted protein [Streptomyces filamentosus NRRL 15998]|uniref:Predicted protein n=1 Tax=Streptomyces filamentosus NRRL 15998 TaxID=457431 RepID=D6ACP1_STRFL|nr:predicted protein [Streptomyces filamentosus NRRL 15998]